MVYTLSFLNYVTTVLRSPLKRVVCLSLNTAGMVEMLCDYALYHCMNPSHRQQLVCGRNGLITQRRDMFEVLEL